MSGNLLFHPFGYLYAAYPVLQINLPDLAHLAAGMEPCILQLEDGWMDVEFVGLPGEFLGLQLEVRERDSRL